MLERRANGGLSRRAGPHHGIADRKRDVPLKADHPGAELIEVDLDPQFHQLLTPG